MLAAAVHQYGTPDSVSGRVTMQNSKVDLVSDGYLLTGSVNVDGKSVDIADLSNPAAAGLSPVIASKAVKLLKTTTRELTQYQGFARYLQGDSSTVRLENEYIALDLSNKGGIISRAELKDYKSYKGGNVVVFEGDDNGYSFILNSADREFDTRNFFFEPFRRATLRC